MQPGVGPPPILEEADLLTFLLRLSPIAYDLAGGRVPSIQKINSLLGRGSGDDGFIAYSWDPFQITDDEYAELARMNAARKQAGSN
jgi:hypothetical protein